jgi:hypothetical protein
MEDAHCMEDQQLMIEIAPMRAENQRMREALEKIMALEPKTGEKANSVAYSLKLIAKMGLGLR